MGQESVRYLLDSDWVPAHLLEGYRVLAEQLLLSIAEHFAELENYPVLRIHGDCHRGNVLWTDGPHFVDFDDCINGPAIQDLWLFLAGDKDAMSIQLGDLLEGYGQFCDFDYRQLRLIEPLRTLRRLVLHSEKTCLITIFGQKLRQEDLTLDGRTRLFALANSLPPVASHPALQLFRWSLPYSMYVMLEHRSLWHRSV